MKKSKLTIKIIEFEDEEIIIEPKITGDLSAEATLIIIATLIKAVRSHRNWFEIIIAIWKGTRYEDLD
jgi:hypothetical protein